MPSGPVVIGYDGSPTAEQALRESAPLLAPSPAVVVVVWETGAFELTELPIRTLEMPPTPIDVRTAVEIDKQLYESAQNGARQGAALAGQLGYQAEGLAVADDVTVAATLVRVATDLDARALVIGSHGHRALREVLLGSTSREVLQKSPCPVLVVRASDPR